MKTPIVLNGGEYLGVTLRDSSDIATSDIKGNVLGLLQLGNSAVPTLGNDITVTEWIDQRISISPDVCEYFVVHFQCIDTCCFKIMEILAIHLRINLEFPITKDV